MRKIVYFINPISGTKNKKHLIDLIEKKTTEAGIAFSIEHTNAAGNYTYMRERIAIEGITDVVVCGGDGSINQVAGALLGCPINIGVIPMGSGNGLAYGAKIPLEPFNALRLIFKGTATYVDAFTINQHFSCMLCGIGFDAQIAYDFAQQKKRGFATYVRQAIKNYFITKPFLFSINVNGTQTNTEAFFICIANSNQFGNRFTIAPKASLSDGLLDIVVVNKMSKLAMLLKVIQHIGFGTVNTIKAAGISYFTATQLTIQNKSGARLHVDGEPTPTADKFDIKIIPKAFKLIMP
jgi:diacylglycerol kinase (ATP)